MVRTKQTEGKPTRQGVSTPPSESRQEAIRVRDFLDGGPIPDFISYAVVEAIREASRRTGAPEPEVHHTRGYDLEALAYLFEAASRIDLRAPGFAVTPLQVLAAHLAAVMAHPETPATLYNPIADELNSMVSNVNLYTADIIERMLESFRQESQEEGGTEDGEQS